MGTEGREVSSPGKSSAVEFVPGYEFWGNGGYVLGCEGVVVDGVLGGGGRGWR